METLMILIMGFLLFLYGILGLGIFLGIRRAVKIQVRFNKREKVSVIIAVRNEENNLASLIECINSQDYADWEAIIVDDNSSDGTYETAQRLCQGNDRIRLIRAGENIQGWGPKKNAIDWGIKTSQGEIILTTDADCRPGEGWISGMAGCFNTETAAVAGYSPLAGGKGLTGRLQALEGLAAGAVSAGLTGWGKPYMATGRNFAYRKSRYLEIGGFGDKGKLPAGDDDLLVQELGKRGRIVFCFQPATFVKSMVEQGGYWSRKRRHFAAAKKFPAQFIGMSAIVFALIAGIIVSIVYGLASSSNAILSAGCAAFAVKIIVDNFILRLGAEKLQAKYKICDFLAAEVLQIPYTLILQPVSFIGGVSWKGRKL